MIHSIEPRLIDSAATCRRAAAHAILEILRQAAEPLIRHDIAGFGQKRSAALAALRLMTKRVSVALREQKRKGIVPGRTGAGAVLGETAP
jgi:hypothetical protein